MENLVALVGGVFGFIANVFANGITISEIDRKAAREAKRRKRHEQWRTRKTFAAANAYYKRLSRQIRRKKVRPNEDFEYGFSVFESDIWGNREPSTLPWTADYWLYALKSVLEKEGGFEVQNGLGDLEFFRCGEPDNVMGVFTLRKRVVLELPI